MSRRPFYKRYGGDRIMSTRDLTLEERAAYDDCLDLMYDRGRPIPDEPRFLAGIIGISARKWGVIRESLIAAGKLVVRGEYLSNPRFERDLNLDTEAHKRAVEWGSMGGKTRAQREKAAREAAAQPGLPLAEQPSKKTVETAPNEDLSSVFSEFSADFQHEKPAETEKKTSKINGAAQGPLKLARAFHIPDREIEDKSSISLATNKAERKPPKPKPKAAPKPQRKAVGMPKRWESGALDKDVAPMVAAWPDEMLSREMARFKSHAADKGRTSKNWNQAWNNWLRKADDDWKRNARRSEGKPSGWDFAGHRQNGPFD